MNEYHFKCLETDYANLVIFLTTLGLLRTVKGVLGMTDGGCWDYLGYIAKPTAVVVGGVTVFDPPLNSASVKWVHVNIITPTDLKALAVTLAATKPVVATALANFGKYILLDGGDNPRKALTPARVFL